MSLANLKEYSRRCATEPDLRERAKAIGLRDIEEHMRQAEALDLRWNRDDMAAFRKELIDADGELRDLTTEELEQVAGGGITVTLAVGLGVAAVMAGGAGAVVGGTATAGAVTAAGGGGW